MYTCVCMVCVHCVMLYTGEVWFTQKISVVVPTEGTYSTCIYGPTYFMCYIHMYLPTYVHVREIIIFIPTRVVLFNTRESKSCSGCD